MDRKNARILAAAFLALLVVAAIVFIMMGGNVPDSPKIVVSNVSMDVGILSDYVNYGVMPSSVNYTVKNLNNIDITTVRISVDGTNYTETSLLVPVGHVVSTTTFLSNVVLSKSTNYNIEFVFTFADRTYQTYPTSCMTL